MKKDKMFYKFALYGFLKNLRFFEPFMILFFREGGLTFLQIGMLYSVRDLATNILEIPTGVYADAFGRRKSMLMAFGAYIISFVIFYVYPNFYVYGLAMILYAFGEAFRSGTHKALILEYLKLNDMSKHKVAYYGRTRAASQFGSAINSLLAAALIFYSGSYRYIFIASIIPYVLDFINLATYPPELDGELTEFKRDQISGQIKTTLATFAGLLKSPNTLRTMMNSSSFTAFFKATKDYLQPILKSFAVSLPIFLMLDQTKRTAVIVGLVYFVIYMLTSYASRSAHTVSQRFPNLSQAVNVTFLTGAGLLFVAGGATQYKIDALSILIFLFLYVLQNVRRPMNVSLISDQISSKVMASGLSVESQLTTVLMAILAPIMGALADKFGVGAALGGLGLLMLLLTPLTWVQPVEEAA